MQLIKQNEQTKKNIQDKELQNLTSTMFCFYLFFLKADFTS